MMFGGFRTMLLAGAVLGAILPHPDLLSAAQLSPDPVALRGRVIDAASGEGVDGAVIQVVEFGRAVRSAADGSFVVEGIPAERVSVSIRRLGYAPAQRSLDLSAGGAERLEVELHASALELPGIIITGSGRERLATEALRITTVLEGAELRRRLGSSVAATISGEPGISERYNGPAATQPVIRGLGGDRVLVLEDGNRTGDIAATAADHAVTAEPMTAERIEVIRGPAGLLYGSSALGGVVNVIRDEVPRRRPDTPEGTLSLQGESVNRGLAAAGSLLGAIGDFAVRGEASGRTAGDTRTPLGALPSTDLTAYSASAALSRVHERGYLGIGIRHYALNYGVPGTFGNETIPGAHEGGVGVDVRRSAVRMDGALFPASGPFHAVEASASYTRFEQAEFERVEEREVVATRFGQLTGSGRLVADHHHEPGGVRVEGAVGLWSFWKDFSAAGSNTGSRPAQQLNLAGFAYEEAALGRFRLQAGARYDWTRVTPTDASDSALLSNVRTREFNAVSGSFAALFEPSDGITLGASLARSFRTPAIEELFSDGPHLANYSFEIGNPDLEPEFGIGADLFARAVGSRATAELTVFRNRLQHFIHYTPTGELDPRFRRYPVYRATQDDAVFRGVEGQAQWEAARGLVLGGQLSHVRAVRADDRQPLPAIPPLSGVLRVRFERPLFFGGVSWSAAAAQRRTSEFERPTDGYSLLGGHAGVRWGRGTTLHTLTLTLDNTFDIAWRDHLSRIREVAPQPGRNLRLLYRVEL